MTIAFTAPLRSGETVDEGRWLPAARRGEPWALERFYDGYQSRVYALCHRLLGRAEDAEDALQATFVRAFAALPAFRGDSAARTWVYRIAVNESMTLLRKRSHAPVELAEARAPMRDDAPAATERLAVHAALARLRPDHRVILTLRFWEDLSYEEIAAVLQVPLPTVKMRLKRAKDEFRKHYGNDHLL